jgi:hypothetical protein
MSCGRYEAGAVLIGAKLREAEHLNANGADCLVGLESGVVLLRRVLFSQDGAIILSPLDPGFGADHDQAIAWLARIIMAIRYY